MESLEPQYELLREVAARSHAVQRRLRRSLPLLWTENALVMNAAPRGARLRRLRIHREQSNIHDLVLEGWSDTRQRRIEWEVSKRIARVDKELQSKARGQRYWDKRSQLQRADLSASRSTQEDRHRSRGAPMAMSDCTAKVSTAAQTDGAKALAPRAVPLDVVAVSERGRDFGSARYLQPTASQQARVNSSSPKRSEGKPGVGRTIDGPERRRGPSSNSAVSPKAVSQGSKTSSAKATSSKENVLSSDLGMKHDILPASNTLVSTTPHLSSPRRPVGTVDDDARVGHPERQQFTATDSKTAGQRSPFLPGVDDGDDESGQVETEKENKLPNSSLPGSAAASCVANSSIGRQVLSEYRTMPSVASFGPGPVLAGRSRSKGRVQGVPLNSDVLRRLFNDLDSDRDGRINRIETCLALHRLQILVPAPKIASFFRNVHAAAVTTDAKRSAYTKSSSSSHHPLDEVINFKQFVAFITAAHDHQNQPAVCPSRAKTKATAQIASPPPLFPSTSVPMVQKRLSPEHLRPTAHKRSVPHPHQSELVQYETEGSVAAESESSVCAEKIAADLPDCLVARILASSSPKHKCDLQDQWRNGAKTYVRKSLEQLGNRITESDDKEMVLLVQELVKGYLQRFDVHDVHDSADLTGLQRAAAYFDQEAELHGRNGSICDSDDAEKRSIGDWVDYLAEEQVQLLIQELCREWRETGIAKSRADMPAKSDQQKGEHDIELMSDNLSEDAGLVDIRDDFAADLSETLTRRVGRVAEKAVQVSGISEGRYSELCSAIEPRSPYFSDTDAEGGLNVLPSVVVSPSTAKTHLGSLALKNVSDVDMSSSCDAANTFQRLRRRRRIAAAFPTASTDHRYHDNVKRAEHGVRGSVRNDRSSSSRSMSSSADSRSVDQSQQQQLSSLGDDHTPQGAMNEPVESYHIGTSSNDNLVVKQLLPELNPGESWDSSGVASSSSSWSSHSVSIGAQSTSSDRMGEVIDTGVRLQQRTFRKWNRSRRVTHGRKSVGTIISAYPENELSEGEIEEHQLEGLSDGEISIDQEQKLIESKNLSSRNHRDARYRPSGLSPVSSSIESGEVLSHISATRLASFLRVGDSSSEPGEVEVGVLQQDLAM